jgi:hypothetical protein
MTEVKNVEDKTNAEDKINEWIPIIIIILLFVTTL